jgi:hypothetical protein
MDAISLVSAWNDITPQLSYIFTEPTARTLAANHTRLDSQTRAHYGNGDMLSALREVLWQHRISPNLSFSSRVKELIETISYGLFAV